MTDISTLGTDYTIADKKGKILRKIQVIPATCILDAALGDYNTEDFFSVSEYLEKSIATLTGFTDISSNRVLWYSSHDEEVALVDIIEYAIKNGYEKIILEYLDPSEE